MVNRYVPLSDGLHACVAAYSVVHGQLFPALRDPSAFVGYTGSAAAPSSVLLQHNHLHIMLCIERGSRFGRTDLAGVSDIMVESSVTRLLTHHLLPAAATRVPQ
jgi:malate synthase